METLWKNLRYGFRLLAKTPATSILIILSLAIGIGATTAIFSVVYGVLFHPLPYRDADKLIQIWETNPSNGVPRFTASPLNYLDWKKMNHAFEDIAVYDTDTFAISGEKEPERVAGAIISPEMFSLLGVSPEIGRSFTKEEEKPGKDGVAIISNELWQRFFGGDKSIIGKQIRLNGKPTIVVGVMPRLFPFPYPETQVWVPFVLDNDALASRGAKWLMTIGRLKPGMTLQKAQADLSAVASALEKEYPKTNKGWNVLLQPLQDRVVENIQKPLWILLASVILVLLIACANVANLLMARNSARRSEVAVRSAMGASRAKLLFQFLTESVLLSLIGGFLGLLLAAWGKDALLAMAAKTLPRVNEISINLPVLIFAMLISILTGIVFGIIPALQISRNPEGELHAMQSRGIARSRVRGVLVIVEVALAMILLMGAGLLIKSLNSLLAVSPGFDPQNVLKFQLQAPESKYPESHDVAMFQNQLMEQLKTIPGVQNLGIISFLPLSRSQWTLSFDIKGRELPEEDQPSAEFRVVSNDYFRTMKIPLKSGMFFSKENREGTTPVALINETMARKYWPGQNPIGQIIAIGDGASEQRTIIGVVGDVKQFSLAEATIPEMYISTVQKASHNFFVLVRSSVPSQSLIPAIRQKIKLVDSEMPLYKVSTMNDVVADSVGRQKFSSYLLSFFAVVALSLALMGLYGLLSYSVVQRTQEISIRMAVGASAGDVLRLVLSSGVRLMIYGIAFGLLGVFAVTRFLQTMLFEVKATDPMTLSVVLAILLFVAIIAVSLPAYRASRVDPIRALRYE